MARAMRTQNSSPSTKHTLLPLDKQVKLKGRLKIKERIELEIGKCLENN